MDKLAKVLKVREQKEQESATLLARSQQARVQAESQQRQLDQLTAEYRERHGEVLQGGAHRFTQFHRFYTQLTLAVDAQREVVNKLTAAEHRDAEHYIAQHKDRRALEELLQQRDLAHKTKQLRAERRSSVRSRSKPMV